MILLLALPALTGAADVFDTRHAANFGDPRPALVDYLARRYPRSAGPQHFCVLGEEGEPRSALIHWREGRRLIRWHGVDPIVPAESLRFAREIDLVRGVVPTQADINSSTYLVTRAWVRATLARCGRHGARYVVMPRRG